MRIKKGDTVYVRTGQDKGKTGRVLWVDTAKNRMLVEGVNKQQKAPASDAEKPQGRHRNDRELRFTSATWRCMVRVRQAEPHGRPAKVIDEGGGRIASGSASKPARKSKDGEYGTD